MSEEKVEKEFEKILQTKDSKTLAFCVLVILFIFKVEIF